MKMVRKSRDWWRSHVRPRVRCCSSSSSSPSLSTRDAKVPPPPPPFSITEKHERFPNTNNRSACPSTNSQTPRRRHSAPGTFRLLLQQASQSTQTDREVEVAAPFASPPPSALPRGPLRVNTSFSGTGCDFEGGPPPIAPPAWYWPFQQPQYRPPGGGGVPNQQASSPPFSFPTRIPFPYPQSTNVEGVVDGTGLATVNHNNYAMFGSPPWLFHYQQNSPPPPPTEPCNTIAWMTPPHGNRSFPSSTSTLSSII